MKKRHLHKTRQPNYNKIAKILRDAGAMHEHARLKNMFPIWRKYYSYGDIEILQKLTSCSYNVIRRALNGEGGSLRVLSQIEDFYNQRIDALSRAAVMLRRESKRDIFKDAAGELADNLKSNHGNKKTLY